MKNLQSGKHCAKNDKEGPKRTKLHICTLAPPGPECPDDALLFGKIRQFPRGPSRRVN